MFELQNLTEQDLEMVEGGSAALILMMPPAVLLAAMEAAAQAEASNQ